VVNEKKTKIPFLMSVIAFHRPLWVVFSQLPWLPIASRVFPPFHIQTTIILVKIKRLISFWARFEHTPL